MKLVPTHIAGLLVVEPTVFGDERGWFMETYHEAKFHQGLKALGLPLPRPFVQDNHSSSKKGVLRGLHYQLPPHAQGKLVRVIEGEIFDVAVDVRPDSPMFGRWTAATLSADNFRQLYVPPGFAHGFCVLSEKAQVEYKCTELYDPADEVGRRASRACGEEPHGIPRVVGGERDEPDERRAEQCDAHELVQTDAAGVRAGQEHGPGRACHARDGDDDARDCRLSGGPRGKAVQNRSEDRHQGSGHHKHAQ